MAIAVGRIFTAPGLSLVIAAQTALGIILLWGVFIFHRTTLAGEKNRVDCAGTYFQTGHGLLLNVYAADQIRKISIHPRVIGSSGERRSTRYDRSRDGAYENKTIEGVYPEYRADIAAGIEPAAFTEFHHDNATTTYEHRGPDQSYTITGIYTVQKDTICYYYNAPGKVVGNFCFYVFIRDSCYFHYYVPEGIPITAKDFDDWSSMAYAKEDAGTCLPNIS